MYFYDQLFVSEKIKHPELVKWRLQHNAGQLAAYVILLPFSPDAPQQLEICHCWNLQQPYYRENEPFVLGLAQGRKDAIELVRKIVQMVYEESGNADIRSHLFPGGIESRFHRSWYGEKPEKAEKKRSEEEV